MTLEATGQLEGDVPVRPRDDDEPALAPQRVGLAGLKGNWSI
jgi:hypothetical protein